MTLSRKKAQRILINVRKERQHDTQAPQHVVEEIQRQNRIHRRAELERQALATLNGTHHEP